MLLFDWFWPISPRWVTLTYKTTTHTVVACLTSVCEFGDFLFQLTLWSRFVTLFLSFPTRHTACFRPIAKIPLSLFHIGLNLIASHRLPP